MTRLTQAFSISIIALAASACGFAAASASAPSTAKPAVVTAPAKPTVAPATAAAKPSASTAAPAPTPVSLPTAKATVPASPAPAATVAATAPASGAAADLSKLPADLYMWVKMCAADDATKKEVCTTTQRLLGSTGLHVVTASIREVTGDPKSRQLMLSGPLGMQLDPGIKANVDKGKVLNLKYALCFVDGCYAQGVADDAFMKLMKSGSDLNITMVNPQGKTVVVPLSLANFSKVYSGKGVDPATAKLQFDILAQAVIAKAKADAAKTSEPATKVN